MSAYSAAHKMLGHFKEPSGNQVLQFHKMKAQSDKETKFVACNPLNSKMTWMYFFVIHLPAVGYHLPNCYFSRTQLPTIQCWAYHEILLSVASTRTPVSLLYVVLSVMEAQPSVTYILSKELAKCWRSYSIGGLNPKLTFCWELLSCGSSTIIRYFHSRRKVDRLLQVK